MQTAKTQATQRRPGRPKDLNAQTINEDTESFRNFIRRYRNSPVTKKDYTDWLGRFMTYCNLPETRAKIKVEVNDNTDLLLFDNNPKTIQNIIKGFIDYSYEVRHLSPATVRGHYMAIKHFYESNEITLNWSIVKDYVGATGNLRLTLDMPYTYEEIHKMLDHADDRKRVVILLLCSTGIRRGAICELKYGDLKWIEEYQIYEIKVYSGFRNNQYVTYCSLECAQALNSYLDLRRRYGEVITENSYLIRKQFSRRVYRNAVKKISDATDPPEKHKLADWDIQNMIYLLVYDSGIRNHENKMKRLGDRHKNMATHSFRKFFENKCLEAGLDPFYVSVLMGHKAGIGVERHYYRPDSITGINSLLELYVKKAMPYLTISDEGRLKLKNLELELKMKEERERQNMVFEMRDKVHKDSITSVAEMVTELKQDKMKTSETILKLQQEIEDLKKNQKKQSE